MLQFIFAYRRRRAITRILPPCSRSKLYDSNGLVATEKYANSTYAVAMPNVHAASSLSAFPPSGAIIVGSGTNAERMTYGAIVNGNEFANIRRETTNLKSHAVGTVITLESDDTVTTTLSEPMDASNLYFRMDFVRVTQPSVSGTLEWRQDANTAMYRQNSMYRFVPKTARTFCRMCWRRARSCWARARWTTIPSCRFSWAAA